MCAEPHDACNHDFECSGQHRTPGKCNCVPKCILCKQSGHHARDKKCLWHGDFVPLHLPGTAPVEDACKEAAIPHTCPRARWVGRAKKDPKGKGKAPAIPDFPEDICCNDNDHLRAYCFCCLALLEDEFHLLYNGGKNDVNPMLVISVMSECKLRKDMGKQKFKEARKNNPSMFHSVEDLRGTLTHMGTTSFLDYAPPDKHTGWEASETEAAERTDDDLIEDLVGRGSVPAADQAIAEWREVWEATPQAIPPAVPTLHTTIIDGKAHNLGWSSANPFGPLAPPVQAGSPSDLAPDV
jgi:hypothetical protein